MGGRIDSGGMRCDGEYEMRERWIYDGDVALVVCCVLY